MKVRLWRGPFNGKVVEYHSMAPVICMSGPKKLTREQKYKMFRESDIYPYQLQTPVVAADYKMVMRPVVFEYNDELILKEVPVQHPDGSYFFEYVDGSKKEW